MTLTQMNYIITISETGSLNKAAEALYISQPSLTNAVKELEKELGIIIFNRSGRGVTLTNDGTEFLMYARQIYGFSLISSAGIPAFSCQLFYQQNTESLTQ